MTCPAGTNYALFMARRTFKVVRSKVQFAPVDTVDEWVAESNSEALKCRDGGHRWGDPFDVDDLGSSGFIRYFKCKARLTQYLDPDGGIMLRKIAYPEGYLLPRGSGRLSQEGRGVIRVASTQSQLSKLAMRKINRSKAS